MSLGKNINNAFKVVFSTLQSVEDLINCLSSNYDDEKYSKPTDKFLRYKTDLSWDGWIYYSFILVFQRREDGNLMDNDWINAPLYAVEINLDSDTNEEEPQIFIAKMEYTDLTGWSKGISPGSHGTIYHPIHADYEESEWSEWFKVEEYLDEYSVITPKENMIAKMDKNYWGFKKLVRKSIPLVSINGDNYLSKIFGTIEELAVLE